MVPSTAAVKPVVLITGASGFVGSAVLRALEADVNFIEINRKPRPSRERQVIWDFRSSLHAAGHFKKATTIMHFAGIVGHCAAMNADQYEVNTVATAHLLELGKEIGIRSFLFCSTGGVYGYQNGQSGETIQPAPVNHYALSKYLAEQLCQFYNPSFSIHVLRPFFPYGAGQRGRLIPSLISAVKEGLVIPLNNRKGQPRINPIHIDDFCEAVRRLYRLGSSVTVNLAGPESLSIREIAALIGGLTGKQPRFEITAGSKTGDLLGSTALLKKLTGFAPAIRMRDGIWSMIHDD